MPPRPHPAIFLCFTLALPSLLPAASTVQFTGPNNGSWTTASNWTPAVVPNNVGSATYDVLLNASSPTITSLASATTSINTLAISVGNTLAVNKPSSITTSLTITAGQLTNAGSLSLNNAGLNFSANATLSGGGAVQLLNSASITGSSTAIVYSDNLITGSGSATNLVNNGTIIATTGTLTLNDSAATANKPLNNGFIRADGGNITLNWNHNSCSAIYTNNSGLIEAVNNSIVNVGWASDVDGGTIRGLGGTVTFASNVVLRNLTLEGNTRSLGNVYIYPAARQRGTLVIQDSASIYLANTSLENSGTITTSSLNSNLIVSGTCNLTGAGLISLNGPVSPITAFSGSLLTSDNTLVGGGAIGSGLVRFINNGSIVASNNSQLTLSPLNATNGFYNYGTLSAQNGNLVLDLSTYTNSGTITAAASRSVFVNGTLSGGTILAEGTFRITVASQVQTLAGAGTLSITAPFTADPPTIGTLILNDTCTLRAAPIPALAAIQSLTIASTSKSRLSLNNHSLAIAPSANKTTLLSSLASYIAKGNNNGLWNGNGITSSTVAANPANLTLALFDNADLALPSFLNVTLSPNSLLITPALIGDANLDNAVNLADYDVWFKNVGGIANLTSHGDFNLDNNIDLADYDAWYKHVGATFPLNPEPGTLNPSSVPEPTSLTLLAATTLLLLFKRRHGTGSVSARPSTPRTTGTPPRAGGHHRAPITSGVQLFRLFQPNRSEKHPRFRAPNSRIPTSLPAIL